MMTHLCKGKTEVFSNSGLKDTLKILQNSDRSPVNDPFQSLNIVKFLRNFEQLTLFIPSKDLEPQYLKDVARHLKLLKLQRGDIFLSQGEPINRYYLIFEGEIQYFTQKQSDNVSAEMNWLRTLQAAQELVEQEKLKPESSSNSLHIRTLQNKIEVSQGHIKALETPERQRQLLMKHQDFFKMHGKVCLYHEIDKKIVPFQSLGDIFDSNLQSPNLMVATKETIIAFLDEEVYSKIFCSAKQQTNFISRSLEKILSNGVNKREIRIMSRHFKEKIIRGVIYLTSDPVKEIFIVKKGIITLTKGKIRVSELTEGRIFGHEDILEKERSVQASTKGDSFCTLLYASLDSLKSAVSGELLSSLSKIGQLKSRQYEETSFKFGNTCFGKAINNNTQQKFTSSGSLFSSSPLHLRSKQLFIAGKIEEEALSNTHKRQYPSPLLFGRISRIRDRNCIPKVDLELPISQMNLAEESQMRKESEKSIREYRLENENKVDESEIQSQILNNKNSTIENQCNREQMIECIKSFARKYQDKIEVVKREPVNSRQSVPRGRACGIIASLNSSINEKRNKIGSNVPELKDLSTSQMKCRRASIKNPSSATNWQVVGTPFSPQYSLNRQLKSPQTLFVSPHMKDQQQQEKFNEIPSNTVIDLPKECISNSVIELPKSTVHFNYSKHVMPLELQVDSDEEDIQTFKLSSKYNQFQQERKLENNVANLDLIISPNYTSHIQYEKQRPHTVYQALSENKQIEPLPAFFQKQKFRLSPTKQGSRVRCLFSAVQSPDHKSSHHLKSSNQAKNIPNSLENDRFAFDVVKGEQIKSPQKQRDDSGTLSKDDESKTQLFSNSLLAKHLEVPQGAIKVLKTHSLYIESTNQTSSEKVNRNISKQEQLSVELQEQYSKSQKKEILLQDKKIQNLKLKYSSPTNLFLNNYCPLLIKQIAQGNQDSGNKKIIDLSRDSREQQQHRDGEIEAGQEFGDVKVFNKCTKSFEKSRSKGKLINNNPLLIRPQSSEKGGGSQNEIGISDN